MGRLAYDGKETFESTVMDHRFGSIPLRLIEEYIGGMGQTYWPKGLPRRPDSEESVDLDRLGLDWQYIELPDWARDIGAFGRLLVDSASIRSGEGTTFERCDFYVAAFSYASGIAEVAHERKRGPIHSYRMRLPKLHSALFDRAWVNRILLLIRRIAARENGGDERKLFGAIPPARLVLTHDVDALDKTGAIRLKQSVFNGFNVLRATLAGNLTLARASLADTTRMALMSLSYDKLEETAALALQRGLRATFHIHSRSRAKRNLRQWLFDPAYHVDDRRLHNFVSRASASGFSFGIHPSFDSWDSADAILEQRQRLEEALEIPILECRQHWLRFSWERTWSAQEQAGISLDSTLGFNDRPGFRTATALVYKPWNFSKNAPYDVIQRPLILMDSHLYAYAPGPIAEVESKIRRLVSEVRVVGGEAAILWHPHTLTPDYGWSDGYSTLLKILAERN